MPDVRSFLALVTDEPLAQAVLSILLEGVAGAVLVFGVVWILLRLLQAINQYPWRPVWLDGLAGSWVIRVTRWVVGIGLAVVPGTVTSSLDWVLVVALGWAWGEASESVYRWLRLIAEHLAKAGHQRLLRLLRGGHDNTEGQA